MLARLTSKNRLTISKATPLSYPDAESSDVIDDNGRIVLAPVHLDRADAVRSKLAGLGITEKDVADAVSWARSESGRTK